MIEAVAGDETRELQRPALEPWHRPGDVLARRGTCLSLARESGTAGGHTTVELGAEEADMVAKFSDKEAVYLSVWPLAGGPNIAPLSPSPGSSTLAPAN